MQLSSRGDVDRSEKRGKSSAEVLQRVSKKKQEDKKCARCRIFSEIDGKADSCLLDSFHR